jgi:cytochrome P450
MPVKDSMPQRSDALHVGPGDERGRQSGPKGSGRPRPSGSSSAMQRGIHFCLGVHLARLEAQRTMEHLLELTANVRLSADHEDSYHPSLLIRRLESLRLSVTARR